MHVTHKVLSYMYVALNDLLHVCNNVRMNVARIKLSNVICFMHVTHKSSVTYIKLSKE